MGKRKRKRKPALEELKHIEKYLPLWRKDVAVTEKEITEAEAVLETHKQSCLDLEANINLLHEAIKYKCRRIKRAEARRRNLLKELRERNAHGKTT